MAAIKRLFEILTGFFLMVASLVLWRWGRLLFSLALAYIIWLLFKIICFVM